MSEEQKTFTSNNWGACVVTTAARDQAIEQSREALEMFKEWTPWSDLSWSELVLFRAIKRFADERGYVLPNPLNKPRLAWGETLIQDVEATCTGKSPFDCKRDVIDRARFKKSELNAGRNPYQQGDSPELFFLMEAVLSAPKFSSSWKNGTKTAHKELHQAFKAYRNSMSKLATSLDRDGKWFFYDKNSKFILDNGLRGSLKALSG